MSMTLEHLTQLRSAKRILENPTIAATITNLIGMPIEKGIELLPEKWSEQISEVTTRSLKIALDAALLTLEHNGQATSDNMWHKIAATATGAVGGAFGLPALAVELPVSTTIILRSIADIARSEGEDLRLAEAKLACLEVFALGGNTPDDDAAETGYFGVRAALASAVTEATKHITDRGLVQEGAPVLLRLIAKIASRFGMTVSQKSAVQAIPVIGAAGGALINLVFIDHFQNMARGHFIVRRLERVYTREIVEIEYRNLND
jgi:EcsC protein family